VIYENQRYWLGLEWCDKMLSQERFNWSDSTGKIYMPKEMAKLPGNTW